MTHTSFPLETAGWTAGNRLQLIAGPCAVEGEQVVMETAEQLVKWSQEFDMPLIFKGSYRKANRSRGDSFTGIGDERALKILRKVRETFHVPVITDIHAASEADLAAEYVDVLQIPAFLCRQTDLLVAAAETGRVVNIKKGQFLAPESMRFAVEKVRDAGNPRAWVTERGTMLGYQDLVVDMRSFPVMGAFAPTIADVTHSLQQPNQGSGVTGGRPELITTIASAAVAAGAHGVFLETHPRPSEALSDGANMLELSRVPELFRRLKAVHAAVRG